MSFLSSIRDWFSEKIEDIRDYTSNIFGRDTGEKEFFDTESSRPADTPADIADIADQAEAEAEPILTEIEQITDQAEAEETSQAAGFINPYDVEAEQEQILSDIFAVYEDQIIDQAEADQAEAEAQADQAEADQDIWSEIDDIFSDYQPEAEAEAGQDIWSEIDDIFSEPVLPDEPASENLADLRDQYIEELSTALNIDPDQLKNLSDEELMILDAQSRIVDEFDLDEVQKELVDEDHEFKGEFDTLEDLFKSIGVGAWSGKYQIIIYMDEDGEIHYIVYEGAS